MGIVYEAEDLSLGRHVALKFLPGEFEEDPSAFERFQREARPPPLSTTPDVCTIYEIGQADGRYFIAMELLEAANPQAAPSASRPWRWRGLLELAIQIADTLDAAHDPEGIIHRDIKPAIFSSPSANQAKVLDFGLAEQTLKAEPMTSGIHPQAPQ